MKKSESVFYWSCSDLYTVPHSFVKSYSTLFSVASQFPPCGMKSQITNISTFSWFWSNSFKLASKIAFKSPWFDAWYLPISLYQRLMINTSAIASANSDVVYSNETHWSPLSAESVPSMSNTRVAFLLAETHTPFVVWRMPNCSSSRTSKVVSKSLLRRVDLPELWPPMMATE